MRVIVSASERSLNPLHEKLHFLSRLHSSLPSFVSSLISSLPLHFVYIHIFRATRGGPCLFAYTDTPLWAIHLVLRGQTIHGFFTVRDILMVVVAYPTFLNSIGRLGELMYCTTWISFPNDDTI